MDLPKSFSTHPTDYNLENFKNHTSPPKKKHSMVLSLENKSSNIFGADQTPTPTRFIRNCEEVGLFQDLQNVNPFEETFRKAVESGKTGNTTLQNSRISMVADDTLHTPHVFPHIIENESVSRLEVQHNSRQVEKSGPGVAGQRERGEGQNTVGGGKNRHHQTVLKVVKQEADTSQLRPIAPSLHPYSGDSVATMSVMNHVPLILQMPDGRLMQLNATPIDMDKNSDLQGPVDLVARVDKSKTEMTSVILHTAPQPAPATKTETENISPLIKEKLKARLGNLTSSQSNTSQNLVALKLGKLGCKEAARNKRSSSASNASNSDDDEETKRQKFLERNRAAAHRCRQKRKFWVEQLEQRAEHMMVSNQQLQLEVTSLKAEVARLKTLLLAHRDCPVTRSIFINNGVLDPAILPANLNPESPVHIMKPLSEEETQFRKNLKKKIRTFSLQKSISQNINQVQENLTSPNLETITETTVVLSKKKRLSLNIESAKQSPCFLDEKNSPLVKNDKFLTSTVLSTEPSELESFHKPVATQVITLNPNVLYRENSLRVSSPPLLAISPQSPCIDYT